MPELDDRSPIYRQIADRIEDDILNGALGEEERVMSTNQYASHYRINPATAAKAFGRLVDDGVLYKKRGIGMFVATGARERLRAQRRDLFVDERVEPLVREARYLGLPLDGIVHEVERAFRRLERADAETHASDGTTGAGDGLRKEHEG